MTAKQLKTLNICKTTATVTSSISGDYNRHFLYSILSLDLRTTGNIIRATSYQRN